MSTVHIMLQGKGGVGKSVVAILLSQYTIVNGRSCVGIDTDLVNASFSQFASLPIQRIHLLSDGEIDPAKFDQLMDILLSLDNGTEAVVDNGAASFVPLCDYLLKNQVLELLEKDAFTRSVSIPTQERPLTIVYCESRMATTDLPTPPLP